ncbi:hypothetical protein Z043_110323 [Scleropages formosus]|uniref:Uncharacterized protein n=1 Tax=Scleropages formosus TaxID=113540 RepID=A0A0N8K009_SCLFO|nr:hypothetical protein Z043_110323 [Scleropages formosus]
MREGVLTFNSLVRQEPRPIGSVSHRERSATMKLEVMMRDLNQWGEEDFARNCTYVVSDQGSDPSFALPLAMTSIPRNLTFEYGPDNEVRRSAAVLRWRSGRYAFPCL